jgi:hypothetical protein
MADIVLAEHQGRAWLVSGERYIDDLLANTLPADVSIEFVACVSHADVNGLWVQNCGESTEGSAPWMIHPAIVNRIRKASPGHSVYFGQWSAMLDDDARSVVEASALWAEKCADAEVVLTSYMDPDGPQTITDLANLRRGVIGAELIRLGVAASRISRGTRDMTGISVVGPDSGRIDIVINSDS